MRVSAAILAVILGSSAALAQGDPRANPAPVPKQAPAAKAQAEAKGRPKPEAAPRRKAKPAEAEAATREKKAETAARQSPPNPSPRPTAAPPRRARRQAVGPAGHLCGDPAGRAHGDPERPDLGRRLHRPDRRRIQRAAGRGREGLPDAAQESGHRRDEPGGARGARRRRRAAQAGGRLAARRGPGDRRARRPARQARHQETPALPNGTRWASEQGQLQVETFRIDTGATLDAVFEQQKKMPRRRIASSALQADSFVISGMQGLKKMVVRGFARERRGARHHHPLRPGDGRHHGPAGGADVERLRAVRHGLRGGGRADAPRRKVEYGTGVFVSPSAMS